MRLGASRSVASQSSRGDDLRLGQSLVPSASTVRREGGSVLIIVLWVAFGLVSIALYFAHAMTFELRASDNRVAAVEAEQAIEGAARYVSYLLANAEEPGSLPDVQTYQRQNVPVGDATFWFIGRGDREDIPDDRSFRLVDEAAKLNLNTATPEMLATLLRMTPELAAAIKDWRDTDSEITTGGAEDETYARRNPSYKCKNSPFETADELRLIFGMDLEILYGEDVNRNGILDPNENDGDASPPDDNRDGRLDPGLAEYVTVYTREASTRSDGSQRINVSNAQGRQQLAALLQEKFGTDRANAILRPLPPGAFGSVLQFYRASGMTADEFAQIESDIRNPNIEGLVNMNTASEAVLACIPGIGTEKASSLVAYRLSNPDKLNSITWVKEVLDEESINRAGPFLTGRTYQFAADIAAVGHHSRGYRRVRFVFDTSESTPKILYRQDLTDLGWALGKDVRNTLSLAQKTQ